MPEPPSAGSPSGRGCTCDRVTGEFLDRLVQAINGEPGATEAEGQTIPTPLKRGSPEGFTKREKTVISMLERYASNEEIAAAMFITKDTLKYHMKNIYGKLGVSTRLEAIRVAVEMGHK